MPTTATKVRTLPTLQSALRDKTIPNSEKIGQQHEIKLDLVFSLVFTKINVTKKKKNTDTNEA